MLMLTVCWFGRCSRFLNVNTPLTLNYNSVRHTSTDNLLG